MPEASSAEGMTAAEEADLAAIKAKTDNLPADPASVTNQTAIKAKTDNLPADPASVTNQTAIKAKTDNLPADPASVTNQTAIKNKTDNLPTDPADASVIAADFDRHLTKLDCWSDEVASVTITGGSTDVNLPNVVVPALPAGATIWKVVVLFKSHTLKDTSGSDNAINGAAAIRVKKSTGAWGVDDIVAYDVIDNSWMVDVSEATEKGGPCFVGAIGNDDLSGEVDGAATYNLRFEDIQADGGNLVLEGVAVGLRIFFY